MNKGIVVISITTGLFILTIIFFVYFRATYVPCEWCSKYGSMATQESTNYYNQQVFIKNLFLFLTFGCFVSGFILPLVYGKHGKQTPKNESPEKKFLNLR